MFARFFPILFEFFTELASSQASLRYSMSGMERARNPKTFRLSARHQWRVLTQLAFVQLEHDFVHEVHQPAPVLDEACMHMFVAGFHSRIVEHDGDVWLD